MFIAWLVQEGEGCDYSIGCGYSLQELKATNKEDAIKELKTLVLGEWDENDCDYDGEGYWGDSELEKCILYEVVEKTNVPLWEWYKERQTNLDNRDKLLQEKEELVQYAKLKEKYGIKY